MQNSRGQAQNRDLEIRRRRAPVRGLLFVVIEYFHMKSDERIQEVNIEYVFGPLEAVRSLCMIEGFVVAVHETCIAVYKPEVSVPSRWRLT
jgi:hypothetical protein